MIVLVTGSSGQLGFDVANLLLKQGNKVLSPSSKELDITNRASIEKYLENISLDAIIHCAAYTAVDLAESEKEQNELVNLQGTKNLVEIAKKHDAKFTFISTDYVFDGTKIGEYVESDMTNPINEYGKMKSESEKYIQDQLEKYFIVRISWVIGINGKNFVKTMLRLSKSMNELNVIDDQFGSPTFTKDLAPLLSDITKSNKYGIYHATNEGFCSWYEFAETIFKLSDISIKVNPIKTSEYPTAAKRPLNSKLSKIKLEKNGFYKLPTWQSSLEEYLNELKGSE